MTDLKLLYVSLIGVLVLALPVWCYDYGDYYGGPGYDYDDGPNYDFLKVECEDRVLPVGKPLTFQDVCGEYGRVYVNLSRFDNGTYPWMLTAYIEDGADESFMQAEIFDNEQYMLSGGDVTSLFTDTVLITNTLADGRIVTIGMNMSRSRLTDNTYFNSTRNHRRTSGDFTQCTFDISPELNEIIFDNDKPTIKYQGLIENFFSASVSGCPSLVSPDDQAGYFMALYTEPDMPHYMRRRRRQAPSTPSYYNGASTPSWNYDGQWGNDNFGMMQDEPVRQVIGIPQKWNGPAGVDTAFSSLQGSLDVDNTVIYGSGWLVLSVDVFNTTGSTISAAKIRYNSTVYNGNFLPTNCSMIVNGWSTDSVGIIQNSSPNMYSGGPSLALHTFNDDSGWRQPHAKADQLGYFYLSVLQKFVENPNDLILAQCTGLGTDNLLRGYIQGIEEPSVDPVNPMDIPSNVSYALSTLNAAYSDLNGVIAMTENKLTDLGTYPDYSSSFAEQLNYEVSRSAFNESLRIARRRFATASYLDDLKSNINEHKRVACALSHMFGSAREYLHNVDPWNLQYSQDDYKRQVAAFAGNVTNAIVLLAALNQPIDEAVYFLGSITSFAHKADIAISNPSGSPPLTFDELFATEDVKLSRKEGKDPSTCSEKPNFMQKFSSTCQIPYSVENTTLMAFKQDICKAVTLRKLAKDIWLPIGLSGLKKLFLDKEYNYQCARDILKPADGVTKIFRWEDIDGKRVLYQGTLSLDMSQVFWSRKAVCRCEPCYNGGGLSSPGYGQSTGSYQSTTTTPYHET